MRTITYEQIWNEDAFVPDMDSVAKAIFAEQEDVQWLTGNGYLPEMWEMDVPDLNQRHYRLMFRVPDPVLTYMLLLFPNYENRIEF